MRIAARLRIQSRSQTPDRTDGPWRAPGTSGGRQARIRDDIRVFEDFSAFLYSASAWVLPAVTAITLHEAAHGWVAWKLGDDTAQRAGRVSFNPARHVDPFGTLILPAILLVMKAPFLFGYAKPVPVNFGRLRQPRRDMIWVAAAGPGINVAMAYLAALLMYATLLFPDIARPWLIENLKNAVLLNRRARGVQHAAASPAGRKPGGPGAAATAARGALREARALRHGHHHRAAHRAAPHSERRWG